MPVERWRQPLLSLAMQRMGSKALRFKSAVTLGFILAIAGFVALGPDGRASQAEDGFLAFLFRNSWTENQAQHTVKPADQEQKAPARIKVSRTGDHPHSRRAAAAGPGNSRQAVCVRLCDGFSFPVGPYGAKDGTDQQEAMCQSDCPDAATALYVLPKGSDKIEEAVNVRTKESYSALPDAFHYKTVLDDACTCHKASALGRTMSVLRDLTLKRGDAIMTPSGLQVYHGGASFPHQRSDFVALAKSSDIKTSQRATYTAIESANRKTAGDPQAIDDTLFSAASPPNPDAPRPARARWTKQASRN